MFLSLIVPVVTLLGLSALAGYVCHRFSKGFWRATFAAAGIATILWCGAVHILFLAFAPNELGPPLPGPVFLIFLLATLSAFTMGVFFRKKRSGDETHPRVPLNVLVLSLATLIAAFAFFTSRSADPVTIQKTTNAQEQWHAKHLNSQFSSIRSMLVGESFTEIDDHGYRQYTILAVEEDGLLIEYFSQMDLRLFGENRIEEDSGTIKLKWKTGVAGGNQVDE